MIVQRRESRKLLIVKTVRLQERARAPQEPTGGVRRRRASDAAGDNRPKAHLPAASRDSLASPPRITEPPRSAHRLAVQDVALSRRKHGFDSRWARQIN